MAIYLYCLLRATREPPAHLHGIDDSPVRALDLGGLGAWVSDTDSSPVVASPERARIHDRIVRAALERETPLPARFGQVVADEAALAELVASRRPQFIAALERVAGMVEMTVRVMTSGPAHDAGGPVSRKGKGPGAGRDYLERLAASHREERNLLAEGAIARERVDAAVRRLVRADSFAGATPGSSMITLSHLVPLENIEAYRAALLQLRDEEPALAIMVSGPWAPYSFSEAISG